MQQMTQYAMSATIVVVSMCQINNLEYIAKRSLLKKIQSCSASINYVPLFLTAALSLQQSYLMYLVRKRLWKSFLMVSLMNRFWALGSPLAWFLKTTSSSQRLVIWKDGAWFKRGFPRATSSRNCDSFSASSSLRFLAASSARSLFILSSSASNSASSSCAKPGYFHTTMIQLSQQSQNKNLASII